MFRATLIALALGGANASFFTNETKSQKYMWESYKTEFGKQYPTMQEENTRFGIFMNNLAVIDQRNAAEAAVGGDAVHGINKFTDLSQEEFATRYLLSDVSFKSGKKAEVAQVKPLPEGVDALVDWTGTYTTPVKDQGYCGSCWAFSATEQIESDCMRVSGETPILSPEQITQCDSTSYGCNGGWTENAYDYVQSAGGMCSESDYPYTSGSGTTGTCKRSLPSTSCAITGYKTISGESAMASYVESTGPLSVCLDANSFNSYTSGIMSVCGTSVDHCVQAVGVDTASGYWKVRNSWGTSWGESGFIRLAYGANTCDITNDPTYVTMA
eukprot:CAMPEP_0182571136 /NCGR_PEP_ID=MMETSP1324-20130603/12288_1 /TAXON_ID=236786 /ORGANISM="Florenciella sp., Strain RCC1587" /LENGTH=326 /DNA_ID=CAMNT_0024785645 /DNA_START=51 /DNA_END=1031 /DNA_ORIENTATION=+